MACCRLASKYEPNEYPSHDPANALEPEPSLPEITPWRLDSWAGSATGIHALQELTSLCSCQLAHFYLLAAVLVRAPGETVKNAFSVIQTPSILNQMTRDSTPELHFEQLVKLVLQAHRLVFSCHHGVPLCLVVQYLWSHWKVVR